MPRPLLARILYSMPRQGRAIRLQLNGSVAEQGEGFLGRYDHLGMGAEAASSCQLLFAVVLYWLLSLLEL